MIQRFRFFLPWIGNIMFYGTILAIVAFSELPPLSQENFDLRKGLLSGNEQILREPGAEFSIFKPYLPEKGAVSFLMDSLYHPYAPAAEQLYLAQSYLAPLILNIVPVEKNALVYCSKGFLADEWMQNTGYRLTVALADGKGIAEKK
jgi:hypothetical protein